MNIFNNIEIEKAILGALMVDKPAQEEILLQFYYKLQGKEAVNQTNSK